MTEHPPQRRRRPAAQQKPPRRDLRLAPILLLFWLLLVALVPVLYPLYLVPVTQAEAQTHRDAIQALVGEPARASVRYPPWEQVVRRCKANGVPFEPDSRWYSLTYDAATGRVGYRITSNDLLIREHATRVVLQRVLKLVVVLVLLIVAAGLGQRILQWIGARGLPLTERLLFGSALGLGAMSLSTLGLGVLGLLSFWSFVVVLLVMGLVGAGPLVDDARELHRGWLATTTHIGIWSGLMAAAGILFVTLPLMGAFGPPTDYDALEYHIGAPAEYYANGRITRLDGNCYSNFPFNVEMLYLMSMVIRGSVIRGVYLGRMLNVLMGVLVGLSIWSFGRRFAGREGGRAGGIGCLLFLSCPWFFWILTTVNVYVTVGLTLFSFLSVYATLIYLYGEEHGVAPERGSGRGDRHLATARSPSPVSGGPRGRRGVLILAGLLIGLALGSKYTAAVFVAVPLAVLVAVVHLARRDFPVAGVAKRTALLTLVALAVVSPWLIKNLVLTGNPTYPLLYRVFGGVDWSAVQDARWRHAHSPAFNAASLGRLWRFVAIDLRFVAPVVVFFPLALRDRRHRRVALLLVGLVFYSVLVWLGLTHRIDRLLFPAFTVLVALSGWGYVSVERTSLRWLGRLVLAGYLIYLALFGAAGYFYVERQGDLIFERLGKDPLVMLSEHDRRYGVRRELPVEAIRFAGGVRPLGPENKLLLVGEAETFYLTMYGRTSFIRSTVFDRNPLADMMRAAGRKWKGATAEGNEALRRELRARDVRYILVNFAAITRFRRTYAFPFGGRTMPGYPPEISRSLFRELTAAGVLRVVFPPSGARPPDAEAGCVIYEVLPKQAGLRR